MKIILIVLCFCLQASGEALNALVFKGKDLGYKVIVGTVDSVSKNPKIIVSAPNNIAQLQTRGFYEIEIRIEEVIYDYRDGTVFMDQLPNLPQRSETILMSSASGDASKWVGPKKGDRKIFFISPSSFDIDSTEVCHGVLGMIEKETLQVEISKALAKHAKYSLDWLKWRNRMKE